jgi:hypothetical protein
VVAQLLPWTPFERPYFALTRGPYSKGEASNKSSASVFEATMRFFRIFSLLSTAPGVLCAEWIVPGAAWTDTDGKKINAHGGGIVKQGNTFYWIGHAATSQSSLSHLMRIKFLD